MSFETPGRSNPITTRRALLRGIGGGALTVLAPAGLAPPPAGAQDATAITWATWGGAAQAELYSQAIEKFHEQQPEIRVQNVNTPDFDSHNQRTLTTAAGGTPYDILMMPGELIPSYVQQGIFAPVEELAATDAAFSEENYFENTLDAMRFVGRLVFELPFDLALASLDVVRAVRPELVAGAPAPAWRRPTHPRLRAPPRPRPRLSTRSRRTDSAPRSIRSDRR